MHTFDKTSFNQSVLSSKNYWEFNTKFDAESFFSIYKYSYTTCNIGESDPTTKISKISAANRTACQYTYADKNTQLNLVADQLHKNDVHYTISVKQNNKSESYTVRNDIDTEYLILTLNDTESGLMFIVNRNWLNTPWSYYNKTPQSQNTLKKH